MPAYPVVAILMAFISFSHARPNSRVDRFISAGYELGTQENVKNDLVIQGSLDQNWVQMIVPAPSAVNLLGRLGLLASRADDFPLTRPENGTYMLLKHPDSFKASLHQVTDWGWRAFRAGHSSMDIIAQRTSQLPKTLYDAVDVLVTEDHNLIAAFMPNYLDEAENHVHECIISAEQTRKKFVDMSEIVSEILQGSLSTKAWNELENERLELEMDSKNRSRSRLEQNVKKINAQIKETKEDVDEWTDKYEQAFDAMPTGWSLLGLRLCDSLTRFTEDVVGSLGKMAAIPGQLGKSGGKGIGAILSLGTGVAGAINDKLTPGVKNDVNPDEIIKKILEDKRLQQNKVSSFSTCTIGLDGSGRKTNNAVRIFSVKEKMALGLLAGEDFVQAINKFKEDIVNTVNPEDITADVTITSHISTFLNLVEEPFNAKGVQDDIKIPVNKIIKMVRNTASEISDSQQSGDTEGKAVKYKTILEKYIGSAECLKAMAEEILDLPIVEPALPFESNEVGSNKASSPDDIVTKHQRLAEEKLQKAETRLKSLEERYEKKLDKQAELTDNLAQVISEIQRLTATAKTVDGILDVLKKALVLLSELEKEWKKITSFFQAVEDRIKHSLGGKMNSMITRLQTIKDMKRSSPTEKALSKYTGNVLYKALLTALAEVELINQVARKYVLISGEHIMPSVTKVSQMINANDENRVTLQSELDEDFAKANDAIESLIRKEQTGFMKQIERRRKEVRDKYEPLLTGLPATVKAEITMNIGAGLQTAVQVSTDTRLAIQDAGTLMRASRPEFGNPNGKSELHWG